MRGRDSALGLVGLSHNVPPGVLPFPDYEWGGFNACDSSWAQFC